MNKKEEAKAILEAINRKMKDEFEKCKGTHYNPNTKGANHEKVVASILREYVGSQFGIHERAQLIDAGMKYLD